jgi:hypothetical protein
MPKTVSIVVILLPHFGENTIVELVVKFLIQNVLCSFPGRDLANPEAFEFATLVKK